MELFRLHAYSVDPQRTTDTEAEPNGGAVTPSAQLKQVIAKNTRTAAFPSRPSSRIRAKYRVKDRCWGRLDPGKRLKAARRPESGGKFWRRSRILRRVAGRRGCILRCIQASKAGDEVAENTAARPDPGGCVAAGLRRGARRFGPGRAHPARLPSRHPPLRPLAHAAEPVLLEALVRRRAGLQAAPRQRGEAQAGDDQPAPTRDPLAVPVGAPARPPPDQPGGRGQGHAAVGAAPARWPRGGGGPRAAAPPDGPGRASASATTPSCSSCCRRDCESARRCTSRSPT